MFCRVCFDERRVHGRLSRSFPPPWIPRTAPTLGERRVTLQHDLPDGIDELAHDAAALVVELVGVVNAEADDEACVCF